MAGPTASLLLPNDFSDARIAYVRRHLVRLASRIDGDDFWIDGRPFIVSFGLEYPEELDELVEQGLPAMLGWAPRDVLGFSAMSNQPQDHRILAELCIHFASKLRGVIGFNGALSGRFVFPRDRRSEPVRVPSTDGLAGMLLATSYFTANGEWATAHYSDVEFLRAWLGHSDFRMVK